MYRILGIAPYEALKKAMTRIAEKRTDLELECYVGDLDKGVEIVQEKDPGSYDAIISRGGTAKAIQSVTDIPVIDIPLSVYDILRAIRLANNYQSNYAIIGFPHITEVAHTLCDLLQYHIRIITIQSEKEVAPALKKLQQEDYHMIICDMISHLYAGQFNMNAILITSGAESIVSAFHQAIQICNSYALIRAENSFLKTILNNPESSTIVMEEDGSIFFSSWKSTQSEEAMISSLRDQRHQYLSQDTQRTFFHSIDRTLFQIDCRVSSYNEKKYLIFYITESKTPLHIGKHGIHFLNQRDVEKQYFSSFYSLTGALGTLNIEDISQSPLPIFLFSEEGTGKESVASLLYLKGSFSSKPYVTVDCSMLNERNWNYLLNQYNSPLNDKEITIFFRNLETLSPNRHHQLLDAMIDANICTRNRVIFSSCGSNNPATASYLREYVKRLNCIQITLQSLRDRRDEIPLLANICLSRLNVELGKQLIGFEPSAIEILSQYDWPLNYSQFQRVLMSAASATEASYISSDTIAELIMNEQATSSYQFLGQEAGKGKLPNLTLNSMVQGIVKKSLEDNGGNQSQTARKLGISRTTLWRYLGGKKNSSSD